jgi:SAM-dependent methyltransferase
VVPGTAESIPLPSGFADAVVAAQAFHWFRPRPTLREVARVLRPGGGIGLVWNVRDPSVGWSRQLTEILDDYGYARTVPSSRDHDRWRPAFEEPQGPFGPLHRRTFAHAQQAPRARFVDRILSVSVIAALPAAERRRVAARVRAVLDRDPATRGRAVLTLPYRTDVFWAVRQGAAPTRPPGPGR